MYLSAAHLVNRDFRGRRLLEDTKQYSQDMINFWPYLRFRHDEVTKRRRIYAQSFLPALRADKKIAGISERLWGSPDNEKQLAIALRYVSTASISHGTLRCIYPRFTLTRFWFALSLGGEGSEHWLDGLVVDAQEVVPEEIWRIAMLQSGDDNRTIATFYVLEATCEVIGFSGEPEPGSEGSGSNGRKLRMACLRADWSSYIHKRGTESASPSNSLLSCIKWAHFEEYERGISRLWLKRTANEGEVGAFKRTVAERYILACVVGNRYGEFAQLRRRLLNVASSSVSGTWMSTTEMAQDFAGMPNLHAPPVLKRTPDLNLFLPA